MSSQPVITSSSCIGAELVGVIEILIAQRQTVDPLSQQLIERVIGLFRVAPGGETARQASPQINPLVGLSQQQAAAIGSSDAAVELGDYLAVPCGCKLEARLDTLCGRELLMLVA